MAINYQPRQPLAPQVSALYGSALQYTAGAPERNAARNAGGGGGDGTLASAYNQARGQTMQLTGLAGQLNMQSAMQTEREQYDTQRQAFDATNRANLWQAQAEQAAAMQRSNQEQERRLSDQKFQQQVEADRIHLGQVEQMQLQQYRNADADISKMLASGKIDEETATEMHFQVRKIAGPLELRAVKSRAMVAEAQAKAVQQEADLKLQTEQKRAELAAKTAHQRTHPILNEDVEERVRREMGPFDPGAAAIFGVASPEQAKQIYEAEVRKRVLADPHGVDARIYTDLDGKTYVIPTSKGKQSADAITQDVEKARGHWESMYKKAAAAVDSEIKRSSKEPGVGVANLQWWQQPGRRDEAISNWMRSAVGVGSQEEYLAGTLTGKYRPPHIPGSQFGMPGSAPSSPQPVQAQPGGPQGQPPAAPKFADIGPKFDPADLSKATPPQQKLVGLWRDDAKAVGESALPRERKLALLGKVQWAIDALAEHGSVARMPPPVQQHYDAIQKELAAMPRVKAPDEQKRDQQRDDLMRNPQNAPAGSGQQIRNAFDQLNRGELITTDDIPGVPFIKRQFK